MAEISIPIKREIRNAIVYSNPSGREFDRGAEIKVYFMPDTVTVPGYKPYNDAQVAADPTLANLNASYKGIDPGKYQAILDNVFGPWARQANISFVRTSNPAEAQIRVGSGNYVDSASVNIPGIGAERVNSVFIRTDFYLRGGSPADFLVGSRETQDLMHEVGHAIGLNHPALPQEGGTLPPEFNSMPFTVMANNGPTVAGYGPSSPSLFDAVGLESLYGLRASNETDNYVIAPNTGRLIIDGGGTDTLNGSATDDEIDLRATDFATGKAYFSSIGMSSTSRYNVAIYEGTAIENATGGSGNDKLIGNDADNILDGGTGRDTLEGGAGADIYQFSGSFGNDTILDAGGSGSIRIGSTALNGGKRQSATVWRSDDDKYEFHFAGNLASGERDMLRILRTGVNTEFNSIVVRNWSQGELNITLSPDKAALSAPPAEYPLQAITLTAESHGPLATDAAGDAYYQWTADASTWIAEPGFADVTGYWNSEYGTSLSKFDNLIASTGAGNDLFDGYMGHDTVDAGADNDLLIGGPGVNVLRAGAGDDIVTVLDAASFGGPLRSGPQDQWSAPAAASVLSSGPTWGAYRDGNGMLVFDDGSAREVTPSPFLLFADPYHPDYESWGNDIDAGEGSDTVFGGLASDTILLGDGDDLAFGFPGNDDILGGGGNDRIYGDRCSFTTASGNFSGLPAGGPVSISLSGDDYIDGGEGDDFISGDYGNNILFGGAGNDVLIGGVDFSLGTVQIADNRLISGIDAQGQVSVDATDTEKGRDAYESMGVNYLDGGLGDDYLVGGYYDDTLLGGAGDDGLYGGLGNDFLSGEGGWDVLAGGRGNDVLVAGLWGGLDGTVSDVTDASALLEGGEGDDTYFVGKGAASISIRTYLAEDPQWGAVGNDRVVIAGGRETTQWSAVNDGTDLIFNAQSQDVTTTIRLEGYFDPGTNAATALSAGIEFEDGSMISANDLVAATTMGTSGANVIYGGTSTGAGSVIDAGGGDDEVYTREGDDTVHAGDGDDFVRGGGGNDVLFGDAGNDTLYGDAGADTLRGGVGDDVMLGGLGADVLDGGEGNDVYVLDQEADPTSGLLVRDEIIDVAGQEILRVPFGVVAGDLMAVWNSPGHLTLHWGTGSVGIAVPANQLGRFSVELAGALHGISTFIHAAPPRPPDPPQNTAVYDEQANAQILLQMRVSVADGLQVAAAQGLLATTYTTAATARWQTISTDAAGLDLTTPVTTSYERPVTQQVFLGYVDRYGRPAVPAEMFSVALPSGCFSSWTLKQAQQLLGAGFEVSRVQLKANTGGGATWVAEITKVTGPLTAVYKTEQVGTETVIVQTQGALTHSVEGGAANNGVRVGPAVVSAGAGNDEVSVVAPDGPAFAWRWAEMMTRLTPRNERFLSGEAYLSFVNGGDGNDAVYGSTLADALTGGAGFNSLYGGTGPDRYLVLARAPDEQGYDYISDTTTYVPAHDDMPTYYGGPADEWIPSGADIDTIEFGPGIRRDEVVFAVMQRALDNQSFVPAPNYDELYLNGGLPAATETYLTIDLQGRRLAAVVLPGHPQAGAGIEQFEFQDGQMLSLTDAVALATRPLTLDTPLPDAYALSNEVLHYTVDPLSFYDPNHRAMNFSATLADGSPLPSWLNWSAESRELSGASPEAFAGDIPIRITATSVDGRRVSDDIVLTITQVITNHAPEIGDALGNATAFEATPFTWQLPPAAFSDIDAQDTLSWTFVPDDAMAGQWLRFDPATLSFSGTPHYADLYQSVTGTVLVTDPQGATASQAVSIDVTDFPGIELTGTDANDSLTGTQGRDFLDGGPGADTMRGGLGQDVYYVDNAGDKVIEKAGEGYDEVNADISYTLPVNVEALTLQGISPLDGTGNTLDNFIVGNVADNKLVGNAGDDELMGQDGDDWLRGNAGADTLFGGTGDDLYTVEDTLDVLVEYADEGVDVVSASVGFVLPDNVENLILTGTEAIDGQGNALDNLLQGNDAANVLSGGDGDDVLGGRKGADTLAGGSGNDTYLLEDDVDAVIEATGGGRDTVISRFSVVLADNIEDGVLTGSALQLTGNPEWNVLTGNAQANTIDGGAGADVMIGGKGNDHYIVDNSGDTVVESAAEGTDDISAAADYALPDNVENLTLTGTAEAGMGNDGVNRLTGNAVSNKLFGGAGNDQLDGGAGADILYGGLGNDTYQVDDASDLVVELSGEGTDTVYTSVSYALPDNVENLILTGSGAINAVGNALNNRIEGNAGNNILFGGGGNDTYVFGRGSGQDVVANFDANKPSGDRVLIGAGIVQADLALARRGDDLVLSINGTTDQLTVAEYFQNGGKGANALEMIRFADGTSWNHSAVLALAAPTGTSADTAILPAPVRAGDPTSLFSAPDPLATAVNDRSTTPASISESIAQARAHFEQGLQQQRSFADSLGTVTRPEFVERRTLPMLWNIQDALLDVQLAKTSGRFASSVAVDARAGTDLTTAFGMLSGVNGTTGRLDQVVRPEQVQQFDLVHFQ